MFNGFQRLNDRLFVSVTDFKTRHQTGEQLTTDRGQGKDLAGFVSGMGKVDFVLMERSSL